MKYKTAATTIALITIVGCKGPNEPSDVVSPEAVTKMETARDALMSTLKGELVAAISQSGPASAITVCRDRAPAVAKEIAAEHNVRIGRTSFRIRNQENDPPAWATSLIEQRIESQYVGISATGVTRAIYPIRTKAECLLCHGQPESMSPAITNKITEFYPHDTATGFVLDELRGYVWVELDKD